MFRYWTIGEVSAGTTINQIATFEGEATLVEIDGDTVDTTGAINFDATTLNVTYIDVLFSQTRGDVFTLTPDADTGIEIALDGAGAAGVTISSAFAPQQLGEGNLVRYFIEGDFSAGEVQVEIRAGSFGSEIEDRFSASKGVS